MPATESPMLKPDPHRRQIAGARRVVGEVAQPAHRLADDAKCCAVALRTVLAVAGNAGDDEVGPCGAQSRFGQPHPVELSGAKILHQHIAMGDECKNGLTTLRMLEIERDTALVSAMNGPPQRFACQPGAPFAHRIALGRLHLDDVGAKIAKQPRAKRGGDEMAKFQHTQTRQRTR